MLSFIPTFSPAECQTKRLEKLNTLLSAISKFCITKIFPNIEKSVDKFLAGCKKNLKLAVHEWRTVVQ